MKHFSLLILILVSCPAFGAEFHVGHDGNDANPGTVEKPFLTLERARDAARNEKNSTIHLAPGSYRLSRTLALDERDSGTHFLGGGNARVTGSASIPASAVKVVSEPAILQRLLPEVRGTVLEIDWRALGINDIGTVGPRGFGRPYVPAPLELIVDDEPLAISRWPKPGTPGEPIGKVIDPGAFRRVGSNPPRGGTFAFATDRPSRWAQADNVWITGLFMHRYADDTVQIKTFDLDNKTLTTLHPHVYGFGAGQPWNRWSALNLLEEISLPGEFMADARTGKLYFLPPAGKDISKCRLEVTLLSEPLVAIEGATGVVFDGVDFECSRGMGVYIERGSACRIQNAALRNLGTVAVCIGQGVDPATLKPASRLLGEYHNYLYGHTTWNRQAGTGHVVSNCRIDNTGAGGVLLGGGDRLTLTPGGNIVENCDIHHFNRWDRTYRTAVNIDGVGNIIRHCLIHDCPGCAILLHGNDHLIEYNEICRAMLEGDDMGAFYMGRDPTERGNILRFNYFHDLSITHRNFALYFDDSGGDGTLVYGNVFRKAGNARSININGGSDIRVINNIFVDRPPIYAKDNGRRHIDEKLCEARLRAVPFDKSPWRERYPELTTYLADRPQMPRGITFSRNLVVNTKLLESASTACENNRIMAKEPDLKTIDIPGFEPIPFDKMRSATGTP